MKTAFLGMGVMGYPMAGHLKKAGHDVTVYNRSPAKAKQWVDEYGGKSAATPAEAALGADIVFACVGRDSDLRQVTLEKDGCFDAMAKGSIFVDHTTASATIARELDAAAKVRGFGIMCGGDAETFARVEPVISVYAKLAKLLGPAGSGQITKMINQICFSATLQGLSEGFSFARASGIDIAAVVDVISQGAAQSWQMDNRHKTMAAGQYDHGFAVEWMRKDLSIVMDEARNNGVSLPMTAMIDQFYAEVEAMGGKRWDTSSLFARQEAARKGSK